MSTSSALSWLVADAITQALEDIDPPSPTVAPEWEAGTLKRSPFSLFSFSSLTVLFFFFDARFRQLSDLSGGSFVLRCHYFSPVVRECQDTRSLCFAESPSEKRFRGIVNEYLPYHWIPRRSSQLLPSTELSKGSLAFSRVCVLLLLCV